METFKNDSINLNQTNQIPFLKIISILSIIDMSNRILSVIVHLSYLAAVFRIKKLRKKSYIFINNFMFANFAYCSIYIFTIKNEKPNFSYDYLNHALCTIASIIWPIFKFTRFYSILLVSIHRFIAVFYISLFKTINSSKQNIIICISFVWLLAISLFFITKYLFDTTYGVNNCHDGYSEELIDSLSYYFVTTLLGTAIPTILVVVLYILIYKKLTKIYQKLSGNDELRSHNNIFNKRESLSIDNVKPLVLHNLRKCQKMTKKSCIKSPNASSTSSSQTTTITSKTTQSKFANQFLMINLFLVISFSASSISGMRNIKDSFNYDYYILIKIMRIINILSCNLIPIFSLMYQK
jgi:hypothetical protein